MVRDAELQARAAPIRFEPEAIVTFHDARSEAEIIVDPISPVHRIVDFDRTSWSDLANEAVPSTAALASWRAACDQYEQAKANEQRPPSRRGPRSAQVSQTGMSAFDAVSSMLLDRNLGG